MFQGRSKSQIVRVAAYAGRMGSMLYVKIPGKTAHIIRGEYPEDHTTCCGLMAIVLLPEIGMV
jgi:hypothetical protein